MPQILLANPAIAIALFVVIYVSDYSLTMGAARLYRSGANQVIVLEGSYELNPVFVSDVDRLRKISPRFLALLCLYSLIIWVVWYLSVVLVPLPQAYFFAVGAIGLVQGPVHIRHMRNIFAFRHARNLDGIAGRIEYSRPFSYSASALELVSFAALYAFLALVCSSWLLAGGAVGCAGLGLGHYRASRVGVAPSRAQ